MVALDLLKKKIFIKPFFFFFGGLGTGSCWCGVHNGGGCQSVCKREACVVNLG